MKRREIIKKLQAANKMFDPAASKNALLSVLNGGTNQSMLRKTLNYAGGRGRIELTLNAADPNAEAQILISEDIGKDAWTGEGIDVKDIQAMLDSITPKNRTLHFLINSQGGIYDTGTSIHNLLVNWAGTINKTVLGMAASTASWFIPADKTMAYKNSRIFIHQAMCSPGMSNADELEQAIDFLRTTDNQIAEMYADQSGGVAADFLDLMKAETLLTGPQAMELGLVDELIDGETENSFSTDWLNSAKKKLAALNTLRPQGINQPTKENTMNLTQKIALLNKRGITPPTNATELQVDALIAQSDALRTQNTNILKVWNVAIPEDATDNAILALVANGKPLTATATAAAAVAATALNTAPALSAEDRQALTELRNQAATSRRREISNEVTRMASAEGGSRIPVLEIDNWINDAVAATDNPTTGNPVLNRLKALDTRAPGVPPLPESINRLDVVNAAIKDVFRGFEAHNEATKSWMRGNDVDVKEIRNQSVAKAHFFKKFRNRFMEVVNTNTIPAQLQRQVILQDVVIRDFARRVVSLSMFSTVFRNVPLQGLNTVEVPYFDLDQSASQAFSSTTGYNTLGNTTSGYREITVGEGATGTGGFGVGHNRAYQGLAFTSQEIARQPYLKIAELAGLKAEKLAFDVWQDILSVVTAANFGAASIVKAAQNFDSDQIALLKLACKAWPEGGRGLIIDSAYDANLLQDPSFKFALNAASDLAIKEGRLFPRVMGFDYTENPNIPTNAWNLVGMAVFKYAILVAFAPVPPVEEVRNAGTVWEMITDPTTGITLEYRQYGTNNTDTATNIIESNYGFAPGLKTGLKAIVSA